MLDRPRRCKKDECRVRSFLSGSNRLRDYYPRHDLLEAIHTQAFSCQDEITASLATRFSSASIFIVPFLRIISWQ